MTHPPPLEVNDPEDRPWRRLAAFFLLELAILAIARAPEEQFSRYAFNDSGADLTIHDLVGRGLRPTIDFGYIYGLLPILINRAWFSLLGASPEAIHIAGVACLALLAVGLARCLAALRVGMAGVALVAVAMNDVLRVGSSTLVQALEPMLLVQALAEQARGRPARALGLVTACVFVKPSMAYVYGLILVIAILSGFRGEVRMIDRLRPFLPALVVAVSLGLILGLIYGFGPLTRSVLSGAGLEVYRRSGYGFFRGDGRAFWLRPEAGVRGYFRFEIGAWLVGSVVLLLMAGREIPKVRMAGGTRRELRPRRVGVIVVTCALLHASFVCLFFASRWSWVYYHSLFLIGLAAISTLGRAAKTAVWMLAALFLISDRAQWHDLRDRWSEPPPSSATAGLWSPSAERDEWLRVLELIEGSRPVLLARVQGGAILFNRFAPPAGAYFVPGHPTTPELERLARQLDEAEVVVRHESFSERWPIIEAELRSFETIHRGPLFEVARRSRPRSGPGQFHSSPRVESQDG